MIHMFEVQKGGSYLEQRELESRAGMKRQCRYRSQKSWGGGIIWNYSSNHEHPRKDLSEELPIRFTFQIAVCLSGQGVSWRSQVSFLKTTEGGPILLLCGDSSSLHNTRGTGCGE